MHLFPDEGNEKSNNADADQTIGDVVNEKTKIIVKILENKKEEYINISKLHSKNESYYNKLFYSFGFFVPYLERLVLRPSTPEGSSTPRTT